MKKFIAAIALATSMLGAQAADCLGEYARMGRQRQIQGDMATMGAMVVSAGAFIATGGVAAPLLAATFGFGWVRHGMPGNQFTAIHDAAEAAKIGELDNYHLRGLVRDVNRDLRRAGQQQFDGAAIAAVLAEANESQAICPEVVNEANGTIHRAVYNKKALREYLIIQLLNPGTEPVLEQVASAE